MSDPKPKLELVWERDGGQLFTHMRGYLRARRELAAAKIEMGVHQEKLIQMIKDRYGRGTHVLFATFKVAAWVYHMVQSARVSHRKAYSADVLRVRDLNKRETEFVQENEEGAL